MYLLRALVPGDGGGGDGGDGGGGDGGGEGGGGELPSMLSIPV
jgi:hypothetical protein